MSEVGPALAWDNEASSRLENSFLRYDLRLVCYPVSPDRRRTTVQFCSQDAKVSVWEIAEARDHDYFFPPTWIDRIMNAILNVGVSRTPAFLGTFEAPDDIADFPAVCERWAASHGWDFVD
jgi:hypothetical protein